MTSRKGKEYQLNMDHTHYLMLDDGRYRSVDTEQYRTYLCKQIIHPHVAKDKQSMQSLRYLTFERAFLSSISYFVF